MGWILYSGPQGMGVFQKVGTFGKYDEAENEAGKIETEDDEDCMICYMNDAGDITDDPEYQTYREEE